MNRLLKAALSGIGTISSSSPGIILQEQSSSTSNNNFHVTSCSEDTVTLASGTTINNKNALPEPGTILAYIGDDSICTPCHTLFRKIVSRKNDDTFHTTLASFADIFPDSVYDDSIADTPIESMLRCTEIHDNYDITVEHSSSTTQQQQQEQRKLSPYPLFPEFFCGIFLNFANLVYLVMFICLGPFGSFLCYAPLTIVVYLWSTPFCGDDLYTEYQNTGFRQPQNTGFRKLKKKDNSSRNHQLLPPREQYPFPSTPNDWTKTDLRGTCIYADCNVGFYPSHCFRCGTDSSCFENATCRRSDDVESANEIISFPTNDNNEFDFTKACDMQNFCYSSNFGKQECDGHFYAAMKDSCPPLQSDDHPEVIFPLSENDLNRNCNLLAILLYLRTKGGFGHDVYADLQLRQQDYQDITCYN